MRHAEYGSGTADAEGKREHREQGIHGTPPEDTNRHTSCPAPAVPHRCHPQIARVSSFTRATLPNFSMA